MAESTKLRGSLANVQGDLTDAEETQLSLWICGKPDGIRLQLLYKASVPEHGCCSTAYHEICDNRGSTIAVAYGKMGHVFGGYSSVDLASGVGINGYIPDKKAFLFNLRERGGSPYTVQFPGTESHLYYNSSFGPAYGHPTNGNQLYFFRNTIEESSGTFKMGCAVANSGEATSYGFNMRSHDLSKLTGDCDEFSDVEVYKVTVLTLLQEPWKKISLGWNTESLQDAKRSVQIFAPPRGLGFQKANVLLVGQVGSGKSSFCNTINSIFRGHITNKANAGSSEHSLTTKFRTYEVRDGGRMLSFRLCDTMGLEEGQSLESLRLPYILDGYLEDNFQFGGEEIITPEVRGYRKNPELKHKVHVVAYLIDGTSVNVMPNGLLDKIRAVRKITNQKQIPLVGLITKVDKLDPQVEGDITKVYYSADIRDMVKNVADKIGLTELQVMPIKNYHKEAELDSSLDILALTALRQILRSAYDKLEDQLDMLGINGDDEGDEPQTTESDMTRKDTRVYVPTSKSHK